MNNREKRVPKVSICMPTYNRERFLSEAIESVLAQDFGDFECIICDDASTDNTEEVIKKYKDERIRYVRNDFNLGQFPNTSRCLNLASGEYVIIFHDDDIMMQGLLKKEAELLDKYPNVGLVVPEFYVIDTNGYVLFKNRANFSEGHKVFPGKDVFYYLTLGRPILDKYKIVWIFPSIMIRKRLLLEVGIFDPDITTAADGLIVYKLLLKSDFCQINDPLFKYRHHESAKVEPSATGVVFDEHLMVLEKTLEFARKENIDLGYDFERKAFKQFARSMVSFRGAITWVGGRFKGSYIRRAIKIIEIFRRCISMDPCILLSPKTYLVVGGSILLPHSIILNIGDLYLKHKK